MNQDPNNPVMQNPAAPQPPVEPMMDPSQSFNPAAAAAPDLGGQPMAPQAPMMENPAPVPEAPAMPEMPTIDANLLQEAIADVPDGVNPNPEEAPAVSVENPTGATPEAPADASPFTTAAPTMDTTPTADPNATPADGEQKSTPSVAFNDPATQPDATPHQIKKPSFLDGKKINPVVLIVAGSAIIIIALIVIIAFVS